MLAFKIVIPRIGTPAFQSCATAKSFVIRLRPDEIGAGNALNVFLSSTKNIIMNFSQFTSSFENELSVSKLIFIKKNKSSRHQ